MKSQKSEKQPGYYQRVPKPFVHWSESLNPSAQYHSDNPGPGYRKVEIVPYAVWSNYTIMEYGDHTKLMYTAPGASSVEVHCWPARWTINLDEILHWVFEHAKELSQ